MPDSENAREMLGPEGVSRAVVLRLRDRMPAKVARMRVRYGASEPELPDIVDIFPVEQDLSSIERFPCIFVIEVDTDGRVSNEQFDMDAFADEYSFRYKMRAFVWVIGEDTNYIALAIQRYILAMREIALGNKIFHDADGNYAQLDPNTVRESIGDIAQDEAGMRLGMAYLEFDITTQEGVTSYMPRPSGGEAEIAIDMISVAPIELMDDH